MKTYIHLLLILSCILPSIAVSKTLLDFQIQVEENGKVISEVNWKNVSNYPSHVLVAQKYAPNGTIALNLGSEVDSITERDGDTIAFTTILRIRKLKYSIGDPEDEFIATFDTREFFLAGKTKIGDIAEFEPEEGIRIEFRVNETEFPSHRSFKNSREFSAYIESLNDEGFSVEYPKED